MTSPSLYWIRRDFRLSDNPALTAAIEQGQPVIPVFIRDASVDALGAAPKWRLGLGLDHLITTFASHGVEVILRSGEPIEVLTKLAHEVGASEIHWNRLYDPDSIARDSEIKTKFKSSPIKAQSHNGHLLFEPWTVDTKTGGFYRVYTPFWNSVKSRDIRAALPKPSTLNGVSGIATESLADWALGASMQRGTAIVRPFARVGEDAAFARLLDFIETDVASYVQRRDIPSVQGTSGLSENLALGEISPYQCWHAGRIAMQEGKAEAETFLKEIVWREFAYHLMYHTPEILSGNWKPDWDAFPWNTDETHPHVIAWKQGRTGIPFVDAAMRQMYVTGTMHNRGRMIVASYLTKHLMTHWKIGQKWFEDCLIDWDPASNAMGWQWSAGSGPDATPYFRVFNPITQLDKFDPKGGYAHSWIAELSEDPSLSALKYFEAIPKGWHLDANSDYPNPIMSPSEGRERALAAYQNRGF